MPGKGRVREKLRWREGRRPRNCAPQGRSISRERTAVRSLDGQAPLARGRRVRPPRLPGKSLPFPPQDLWIIISDYIRRHS